MKQIVGEFLFLAQDTTINPSEEALRVAKELERYISTHEESE